MMSMTGFQDFRISGFQDFRISGFQDYFELISGQGKHKIIQLKVR